MTTAQEVTHRRSARPRPEINRQATFWWRFMRWSGVLLILAFAIWRSCISSTAWRIGYQWVIETRWSLPLAPLRRLSALVCRAARLPGLADRHYDYVHNRGWNRALSILMAVLLVAILALGTIALIGAPFELP